MSKKDPLASHQRYSRSYGTLILEFFSHVEGAMRVIQSEHSLLLAQLSLWEAKETDTQLGAAATRCLPNHP